MQPALGVLRNWGLKHFISTNLALIFKTAAVKEF